jgi:hypothetical protein
MDTNTDILTILQQGSLTIQGEFMWGSNYTFLAQAECESQSVACVYKPSRGERPLWDFPAASLARREVAAFLVSEVLGWSFVPCTVYREKGPLGPGSLQLYIEHDPEYHYFNFSDADRQQLRPVVLFDLLINNADRKGSHILKDSEGKFWLIDHGVCFHAEDKLRTVIWDFVGEPIPENLCANITQLSKSILDQNGKLTSNAEPLLKYLSKAEVRALAQRGMELVSQGLFPGPDPYRRPFPWPQI